MAKSKKVIEIEKRGPLNPLKKKKLKSFLRKKAKLLGEFNQLSVFIESDNAITGNIENAKASIAIAIQKNILTRKTKCELKVKVGKFESGARKEIVIPFTFNNINQILDFLRVFGLVEGCPRYYHRTDYKLDNYIISIKESGLLADHFEIETSVENTDDIASEEKKMKLWLKKQKLSVYTQESYKKLILKILIM